MIKIFVLSIFEWPFYSGFTLLPITLHVHVPSIYFLLCILMDLFSLSLYIYAAENATIVIVIKYFSWSNLAETSVCPR